MPIRLLVATANPHKIREIRRILAASELRLLGLADLPRPVAEPEEPFDTFRANAAHKALHYASATGLLTLADDSGLRVHALDGAPGTRSKRFSGRDDLHGAALDRENNRVLLERLLGLPAHRRAAHYVCAAALALPAGVLREVAIGTCAGRILDHADGDNGFGYDPFFFVAACGATFGRLTPATKDRVSHRARAIRALAADISRRP